MMLTLPFRNVTFGDTLLSKSALLGGTLQSVGQVVAGAIWLILNSEILMLFKITRIIFLVVVVFLFERKSTKRWTKDN